MRKIFALLVLLWFIPVQVVADGINIPGLLKSKIITISRDISAVNGNVAYTGIGFKPSTCLGAGSTNAALTNTTLFGMMDSVGTGRALYSFGTVFGTTTHFLFFADATVTNTSSADLASYDADGFTLTWTKVASPTGTATVEVICYQ